MSLATTSPLKKLVGQPIPKEPGEQPLDEDLPRFHFKDPAPEDWRVNEAPLSDLYQREIVSAEYVRRRLSIPEEAGKGTMAPAPQAQPKPLGDVKPGERQSVRHTKHRN